MKSIKDRLDQLERKLERLERLLCYGGLRDYHELPAEIDNLTAEDRQSLIDFGHTVKEILDAAPNRQETAAEILKILHSV